MLPRTAAGQKGTGNDPCQLKLETTRCRPVMGNHSHQGSSDNTNTKPIRRNNMKTLTCIAMMCACVAHAEPSHKFWAALHQVETQGRHGAIKGDGGRALGPLQIHHVYWKDAKVKGKYSDCSDLAYSITVAKAYMKRYAPKAYRDNNYEVLARIHNGGPSGHKKLATIKYWNKVRKEMK